MNLLETIKNQKTIDIINKNEDFYVSNKKNTAMKISENIKNPILINIINKSECFKVLNKILNTKEIKVKTSFSTILKSVIYKETKERLKLEEAIKKEFFNLFGVVLRVTFISEGISFLFYKNNKEISFLLKNYESDYVMERFSISRVENGKLDSSCVIFYIQGKKLIFDFNSYNIYLEDCEEILSHLKENTFFTTSDLHKHTMIWGSTGLGKSFVWPSKEKIVDNELFFNIYSSLFNKDYKKLSDIINVDSLVNDNNKTYDFILDNYKKIDLNIFEIESLYV